MIAPNDMRNRLAKLAVECASESNARLRPRRWSPDVRPRGGPKAKGWKGAGLALGLPFQLIKRACQGESVSPKTIERIQAALALQRQRPDDQKGGA